MVGECAIRELLADLAAARAELRASYAGLSEARQTQGEVKPGYTVRDILAHLAAWDREVLATLESHLYEERPYQMALASVEAWNEETRRQFLRLPLVQAEMACLMARGEIESLLALSFRESLDVEIQFPWDERGTIRELVATMCVAHDREHAAEIRAWREREGV